MIDASIVLCSYNRPDMLKEAIASAVALMVPEIIIVDDYSANQGVRLVMADARRHDKRIQLIFHKTNGGESATLNSGIQAATRDWIIPLHDDDRRLGATETMIDAGEKAGLDVMWGDAETINLRGEVVKIEKGAPPDIIRSWREDYFFFPAMAWRREIHARVGWFDTDLRSNLDWYFKMLCLRECRCGYFPYPVVQYRRHPRNKSTVNAGRVMKNCERMLREKIVARYGPQ